MTGPLWRRRLTLGGCALSLWILLAPATFAQGPDPQQLFQEAVAAQQRGDAALAVSR
jgi:hypothetical protein